MIYLFLLFVAGAYLVGSVPTGYLAIKWEKGIDIREYGSGNVGLSNVAAHGSKLAVVITGVFDLFKGMAPVFLAQYLDFETYQQVAVGIAAVSGHSWSVFLGFNTGRSALTTFGVVFALTPWLALVVLTFALLWIPLKQFALGVLIAGILIPILSWFASEPLHIDQSLTLTLGFTAVVLLVIIRRLTIPRTEIWEILPLWKILLNRFFFDRDADKREAWLGRRRSKKLLQP